MNRVRRALILLAVSMAISVAVLIARVLNAGGMFTEVKPGFSGACNAFSRIAGIEDLQIDRPDNLVFVSATDGRAILSGRPSARDGIYTMALDKPDAGFTRLAGTPPNFHPHGISVYRAPDNSLTLMAVNQPVGQDPAVEIFDVSFSRGTATLKERATVTGGLLVFPKDVAAVGKDQFYATNGWTSRSGLGKALEQYALLPRANVVFFDGNVFRVVADNLNLANGILASPDGVHVYVATTAGRTLYAYERNPLNGDLKEIGMLSIPAGLDQVEFGEANDLWVAGSPKPFAMSVYRTNASKPAPSAVFKVTLSGGIPQSALPVYTNMGDQIGGAGVGAVVDGHLFIGSPLDSKLLDCRMK